MSLCYANSASWTVLYSAYPVHVHYLNTAWSLHMLTILMNSQVACMEQWSKVAFAAIVTVHFYIINGKFFRATQAHGCKADLPFLEATATRHKHVLQENVFCFKRLCMCSECLCFKGCCIQSRCQFLQVFFTPLALRAFDNKWLRLLRAVCFTAVCHSSTVLWTDGNSKHGLPRGNITHCPHIFMIHGGTPAGRGMLPLFRCTICTISSLTKWPM